MLTQKQEAFSVAYVEHGKAVEAYRVAYDAKGMAKRTIEKRASELLQNGEIAGRIVELRSAAAQEAVLSRAWILQRLMRNAKIALGEERIKLTFRSKDKSETVEVEVTQRDAAAANRALELLGRTEEMKLFSDRARDDQDVDAPALGEERPRETGADHLAELARRYGRGLQIVQGGLAQSTKGTA